MSGLIRASPQHIRAGAAQFPAAGEAVAAALRSLRGALPDAAGMCGDDAAGHAFLASYAPRVAQLEQALSAVATGLDSIGPGLTATAANIEAADGASVMRTSSP